MQAPLTLEAVRELTADALDSLIVSPASATRDYFDPIAKHFTPRRDVYATELRRRELFALRHAPPPPEPPRPARTRRRTNLRKGGVSSCNA